MGVHFVQRGAELLLFGIGERGEELRLRDFAAAQRFFHGAAGPEKLPDGALGGDVLFPFQRMFFGMKMRGAAVFGRGGLALCKVGSAVFAADGVGGAVFAAARVKTFQGFWILR